MQHDQIKVNILDSYDTSSSFIAVARLAQSIYVIWHYPSYLFLCRNALIAFVFKHQSKGLPFVTHALAALLTVSLAATVVSINIPVVNRVFHDGKFITGIVLGTLFPSACALRLSGFRYMLIDFTHLAMLLFGGVMVYLMYV